jgi:Zn-finger nucleic acid-binding protein
VALQMTERQDVEIDYCPKCRGVWLDRGELDKIIDRSASVEHSNPPSRPYEEQPYDPRHSRDPRRRHKKKSFLNDIFDFD